MSELIDVIDTGQNIFDAACCRPPSSKSKALHDVILHKLKQRVGLLMLEHRHRSKNQELLSVDVFCFHAIVGNS